MLAPYRGACELAVARYRKFSGNSAHIPTREISPADGDPAVGPYRLEPNGNLRRFEARHTAYDRALVNRYPWLRPSSELLESAACGVDTAHQERGLIQLRRRTAIGYEGSTKP